MSSLKGHRVLLHGKRCLYSDMKCYISTSSCLLKKAKSPPMYIAWSKVITDREVNRIEAGLPRTGNEYGPLTDKPDWSFPDGRFGYATSGQMRRRSEQHDIAKEIIETRQQLHNIKQQQQHDDAADVLISNFSTAKESLQ